tara:strand:+ start:329 stop:550 length:222 start_codon:yes stop_codon:yes gene_type:complete
MDMLTIIRTKLGLGGDVTLGELKLCILDLLNLIEKNTGKINELEDKLNALTARSSGGTKKSSPSSKVQPTNAK